MVKREGKYKRDDDEAASEDDDKEVKEEGAAPDVSQHRGAGKADTIEEGEDDEETDDLKETFQRRNNLLFEKLCNWSKK